mgnify:CR=1 FL=1
MRTLLSLSVAVLAGLLMTRVAKPLKLPSVTAYLVAGVLIGPYCLGLLGIEGLGFPTQEAVDSLSLISEVALGFIAFSIGSEFRVSELKHTGKQAFVIGVLQALAATPAFKWLNTLGPNLVSIFIVFALLYWVSMARIVRSQVLALKEAEYVTAARALGASNGRIIKKHLLTNCIGTLIVTTTLQIPSSIFTESFMSFLGIGVAVPLPSLGSLATDALNGMNTYPYLLFLPAILISVIILSFNLLGDGLRDAFDPKLKD